MVLHALALVAGSREPLDRGFAAVAAGDRLLQRWASRLCPPLAAGEALATVLRRHRLVSRNEAELIASDRDTADALRRVAGGALRPLPGSLIARWFLTCLATVLAIGGLAGAAVNQICLGQVMRDLNVLQPVGYRGLIGWLTLAGWLLLGVAAVWCIEIAPRAALRWSWAWRVRLATGQIIGWIPVPPDPQLFLAPESCQCEAMCRCLAEARLGRTGSADCWWQAWWSLAQWRLPPAIRHGLVSEPLLERRLLGLGILAMGPGGPDWGAACDGANAALAEALAEDAPTLQAALLIALLLALLGGLLLPLIQIVTQLNGGM